jgi:hypothetical protein
LLSSGTVGLAGGYALNDDPLVPYQRLQSMGFEERTHCLNDITSPDRVISENIGVPGGDRRRINAETGPNRWPITRSVQRAYAIAALRPAIAGVR